MNNKLWVFVGVLVFAALIYLLNPVLSPFVTGLAIAYMADPAADWLESKGLSRTGAVALCFAALTLVLTLSLVILLPMLMHQAKILIGLIPQGLTWIDESLLPWVQTQLGISLADIDWKTLWTGVDWSATTNFLSGLLGNIGQSSATMLTVLANLVLIPVVTFYLLRDWDKLVANIDSLIPFRHQARVRQLANECHQVLKAFIRGQLLVMLALALMYSTGLMVIGLDLALIIGIVAGLASIIPYMGFIIGIGAALLAAVFQFQDWLPIVGVIMVFGIGQMIESMVLTPLLVGDKIGLHPVAVIFALMAGGQLFGFFGMLIALPVAAVIMVILRHVHGGYMDSDFYHPEATTQDNKAAKNAP